jgi:hypothetical protein
VGRHSDDETAAKVERLYNQGMKWATIKSHMDQAGVHRSTDAYQQLLKRYRQRKKPTN